MITVFRVAHSVGLSAVIICSTLFVVWSEAAWSEIFAPQQPTIEGQAIDVDQDLNIHIRLNSDDESEGEVVILDLDVDHISSNLNYLLLQVFFRGRPVVCSVDSAESPQSASMCYTQMVQADGSVSDSYYLSLYNMVIMARCISESKIDLGANDIWTCNYPEKAEE
ncbi:hypothetical protein EU803_14975 [Loktanella sp. IMCC34160]|uniref:hypothetical protein n=1 Tax=Loktanella sp. IMCC34160 TaxID=2510646 RepID=UPI00101DAEF8|nr:hypothetical protein [Loktanella sp. IMCC34160]RYG89924.1 hypothetical protein EU803_14975 [Loktanella sp. IMCC34160]